MTTATEPQDVLVVTADEAVSRRAQRIVAAAGLTPVVRTAPDALERWRDTEAVLVGADSLAALLDEDPVRRDAVYVVALDELPDRAWRDCVALGVNDAVTFEEAEGWLIDRLSLRSSEANTGLTVRVLGAAGGCGASVTAAGLALAADEEGAVLLDTNLRSGCSDLLLGLEPDGLGWAELSNLRGRVGGEALTASIPERDGVSLVAASRENLQDELPPDALRAAVLAAAGLGTLVVIDDHAASGLRRTTAQLADATVIVTTSDLRGGLAARATLEDLRGRADRERGAPASDGGPVIVAARTPRGVGLATATFAELTDLADDVFWLPEAPRIGRRIARGQAGLLGGDRFVRECAVLLDRCDDLAGAR